ncbi:hypothetical protein CYY_005323, partial [Polysphondylium violaceum]
IKDLDHFHIYNSHQNKHLITHIIVSSHFYVNHYNIVQKQPQHQQPILFGLSITTPEDPLILATELPLSIKYFKYTTVSQRLTKEYLPQTITSLYIDISVSIDQIPKSVKTLTIDSSYQSKRDEKRLENMKFHHLSQLLPPSLTKFQFNDFSHKAKIDFNLNQMPPNLTYLAIFGDFTFTGNGNGSLKYLKLNTKVSDRPYLIPTSVTQLKMTTPSINSTLLPPNLNHLEYNFIGLHGETATAPNKFPEKLTTLSLKNCSFTNISKNNWPSSVLDYRNWSEQSEKDVPYLPPSLTKARLSIHNDMKEFPILPSSLIELKMVSTRRFETFAGPSPLHSYFPNTIVKLALEYSDELFIGLIPTSVTDLKLHYSKPIPKGAIPNSVTKLHLFNSSSDLAKPIVIPNSVTYLNFEFERQLYPELEIPDSVKTLKIKYMEFLKITPFLNYFKTTFKNITRFSTRSSIYKKIKLIVEKLRDKKLFPNLKQINVVGGNYHFTDQNMVYKEVDYKSNSVGSSNFKNKYK